MSIWDELEAALNQEQTEDLGVSYELALAAQQAIARGRELEAERDRYRAALEDLMEAHRIIFKTCLFTAFRAGKSNFNQAWKQAEDLLKGPK